MSKEARRRRVQQQDRFEMNCPPSVHTRLRHAQQKQRFEWNRPPSVRILHGPIFNDSPNRYLIPEHPNRYIMPLFPPQRVRSNEPSPQLEHAVAVQSPPWCPSPGSVEDHEVAELGEELALEPGAGSGVDRPRHSGLAAIVFIS